MMQNEQASLFARHDTFFGVCEAIGEDFGFNANLLRIAFALAIFFNPVAVLATYFALGAVVLLSRKLFPAPRPAKIVEEEPQIVEEAPLPLAA